MKRKDVKAMTEQDKRNVRELFESLVKTYELLITSRAEGYIKYNVGKSTRHCVSGLIVELMRDYPFCSLRVKHQCCFHDYDNDNRCAICGNIIDESLN